MEAGGKSTKLKMENSKNPIEEEKLTSAEGDVPGKDTDSS